MLDFFLLSFLNTTSANTLSLFVYGLNDGERFNDTAGDCRQSSDIQRNLVVLWTLQRVNKHLKALKDPALQLLSNLSSLIVSIPAR